MEVQRAEHFFRNLQFFPDGAKINVQSSGESFSQFKSSDINKGGFRVYLLGHWSSNMIEGIGIDAQSPAVALTSDGVAVATVGHFAAGENGLYRLSVRGKNPLSDHQSRLVSVGLHVDGWGKSFSFIYSTDPNQAPGPLSAEFWKHTMKPSEKPVYLMVSPADGDILRNLRGSLRVYTPIPKSHILL